LVIKYTNCIREFFIPRRGNILISADYEQLEPTVFAHISGDPALHRIFNTGLDFYSEVAIRTEGLEGVSSNKQASNYLGKVNKSKRQTAKAYALGIAYGMTAYKLHKDLGISKAEAERLVSDYLAAFPKLASWMQSSKLQMLSSGFVTSEGGRKRREPQAADLYEKWGDCLASGLSVWKKFHGSSQLEEAQKAQRLFSNIMNNAINFQVQSLAASIVNKAAIELARQGLVPVMQVHDELVYEVPTDDFEMIACTIKSVMETIWPLSVPLRTSPQGGANYRDCK
jgi:DNA polymerase-1